MIVLEVLPWGTLGLFLAGVVVGGLLGWLACWMAVRRGTA